MKTIFAVTAAMFVLIACENVPTAASKECARHNLSAAEHADCVAKLKNNEAELREAD